MANRTSAAKGPSTQQRLQELLQRWQQSLDLHHKYLALDDAHYWHVQPWPKHERPAPWIVQLARQKLAALSRTLAAASGPAAEELAAALEQMQFLSNLVGLQSVERHIPLAETHHERVEALRGASAPAIPPQAAAAAATNASGDEGASDSTREMPRPRVARSPRVMPANRASVHTSVAPRSVSAARTTAPRATAARGDNATRPTAAAAPAPGAQELQVMQDAARLLQWGRKWHELGELISRLHERPNLTDVRRILRSHRPRIEELAATRH